MTRPRRLLVLDDDPDFAAFVATVGTRTGFAVTVTATAQEFERAYLEAPPDVITLDMVMADRDGVETVKWLASQQCPARIIIMSGFNVLYSRAAKALGEIRGDLRISTLQKPVKLADLRAALTAGLDGESLDKPA